MIAHKLALQKAKMQEEWTLKLMEVEYRVDQI
jgi:chromosome segregation ATPase